ncbi:hypothetical protein Tco_1085598, partial [Tanacetum coccineum]
DKDWSKVILTDEVKYHVVDKYGMDWAYDEQKFDIILEDLWQKSNNEPKVAEVVEVIVISSNDDDLSTDEEIVLMGDIPFSATDDDSDDNHSSKHYKKISMTRCVLFLRARAAPAPVDQYVWKRIKSQVKVTKCVLALRVVNAPDVDVRSSSTRRKSMYAFIFDICSLVVKLLLVV